MALWSADTEATRTTRTTLDPRSSISNSTTVVTAMATRSTECNHDGDEICIGSHDHGLSSVTTDLVQMTDPSFVDSMYQLKDMDGHDHDDRGTMGSVG